MTTTYETAQAAYSSACEALTEVQSRASKTFTRRDDLRSELAALEAKLRELLTEAAVDGPSGGNTRDQATAKAAIAKTQSELVEIEESAGVFDEAIDQAAGRVATTHSALESVICGNAKKEFAAVCEELKAVSTPLIEKALALEPLQYPSGHSALWSKENAKSLLERLGLLSVKAGETQHNRPPFPEAARNRKPKPAPQEEVKRGSFDLGQQSSGDHIGAAAKMR
jgi:chromosome segregation ATPase